MYKYIYICPLLFICGLDLKITCQQGVTKSLKVGCPMGIHLENLAVHKQMKVAL